MHVTRIERIPARGRNNILNALAEARSVNCIFINWEPFAAILFWPHRRRHSYFVVSSWLADAELIVLCLCQALVDADVEIRWR